MLVLMLPRFCARVPEAEFDARFFETAAASVEYSCSDPLFLRSSRNHCLQRLKEYASVLRYGQDAHPWDSTIIPRSSCCFLQPIDGFLKLGKLASQQANFCHRIHRRFSERSS